VNRRGFFNDSLMVIIILFVFALSIIIAYFTYGTLNQAFQDSPLIDQENKDRFEDGFDRFPAVWDYGFLLVVVCIFMAAWVVSFLLPSNPVFLIIAILITAIFGAIAGFLANAWVAIMSEDIFAPVAANFPITSFFIEHYVLAIVILVFTMALVFYMKPAITGEQ